MQDIVRHPYKLGSTIFDDDAPEGHDRKRTRAHRLSGAEGGDPAAARRGDGQGAVVTRGPAARGRRNDPRYVPFCPRAPPPSGMYVHIPSIYDYI